MDHVFVTSTGSERNVPRVHVIVRERGSPPRVDVSVRIRFKDYTAKSLRDVLVSMSVVIMEFARITDAIVEVVGLGYHVVFPYHLVVNRRKRRRGGFLKVYDKIKNIT